MPITPSSVTYGVRDDIQVAIRDKQDFIPIATRLFPVLEVRKKHGQYGKLGLGNFAQNVSDDSLQRSPDGKARRLKLRWGEILYTCKEDVLEAAYDDSDRAEYESQFAMEAAQAEMLLRALRIARERRAAALAYDVSTTFTTGNGNYYDPTVAFSSDSAKIKRYVATCLGMLNDIGGDPLNAELQCSYNLVLQLMLAENLVTDVRGVSVVTLDMVAANIKRLALQLGVKDIVVGNVPYNTKADNQTPVLDNIWTDSYCLIGNFGAEGAGPDQACLGRTHVNVSDRGYETIDIYRDESVRADVIRVGGSVGVQVNMSNRAVVLKTGL